MQIIEKVHLAPEVSSDLSMQNGLLYTWTRNLKGVDEKTIEDIKALKAEIIKLK